jgi:hypothetical protein
MKNFFVSAAIIAACVAGLTNSTANNVDAKNVQITTAVSAMETYTGIAYDLVMDSRPISGNYPAKFDIDSISGDITGYFTVNDVMQEFYPEGNLYDGTATGYVVIDVYAPIQLPFTAELFDVAFQGNSVTFSCDATIDLLGIKSSFTFSGDK